MYYRRQGLFLKHNEMYLTHLQFDYRGFLENKQNPNLLGTKYDLLVILVSPWFVSLLWATTALLKIISWAVCSAADTQFCYSFSVTTNLNLILWSCRQRFLC